MATDSNLMDKIISLSKRRGFIYQGSELYGGLAGTWDYGPHGVALKNRIKNLWWRTFVDGREDMFGLDAAILMNPRVWQASGHVDTFTDPLVECKDCHQRFRADQIGFPAPDGDGSVSGVFDVPKCPNCGKKNWTAVRRFNMMFKTQIGAVEDSSGMVYLRPETAQGIFVNFKNIIDSFHPKLPFGIGQIGKAFRNEITPRDFIFRVREFEQMEIEYFVRPNDWERAFESWRKDIWSFLNKLGFTDRDVSEYLVPKDDLAHYSKRTIDFEFEYPFGKSELLGMAYRTDYDLSQHAAESGTDLSYLDEETKEKFVPHVIEPSFGVDRLVLAVLCRAYREDEMNGELRSYLALPKELAPVRVAVFPLLKNKPDLVATAREVYSQIRAVIPQSVFDDNGNIGKRYRRQDEIGTPYCVTVDFETLETGTVTLRDRDSGAQKRLPIAELPARLAE